MFQSVQHELSLGSTDRCPLQMTRISYGWRVNGAHQEPWDESKQSVVHRASVVGLPYKSIQIVDSLFIRIETQQLYPDEEVRSDRE